MKDLWPILKTFRFESWWLLALLALIPLWAWFRGRYSPVAAVEFSSSDLLRAASRKPQAHRRFWLLALRYLALALALAVPCLIGVAFISTLWLLYAASALLGFFIVGALPIGMQYAAEITQPTPEGTSNGLIQLFGQCSVAFVWVMGVLRTGNGSFTVSLVLASVLLAVAAFAVSRLKDAAPAATPAASADLEAR